MKGPSMNDSSHSPSANTNFVGTGYHQGQVFDQNQAGGVSPQRLLNLNQNNSSSPYRDFRPRVTGYANVEPVQEQLPAQDPFAEYAWMGEEDEFDQQVLEQMEQEAFFEACVRQLCEDEEDDKWQSYPQGDQNSYQAENDMSRLAISEPPSNSALNPNAVEFVPRWLTRQQ